MPRKDAGDNEHNGQHNGHKPTAVTARPAAQHRVQPPQTPPQTPPPGYALVPIGPQDAPDGGGGIVAPSSLPGGPYLLSDGRVFLMPPATNELKNSGYWPGGSGNGQQPYPDMPKVSSRKPLLEMMGATGTAIPSGIITSEEYNEDFTWKDGIKIYEAMSRSEGQAAAIYQILELPIRRATWSVEPFSDAPADKEVASFIQTCLLTTEIKRKTTTGRVLTQKWDDIIRHALMMLRFGFMAFEVCWRVEDGWVKWAHFLPLLPRTIWRWWTGPDNELEGIQQYTWKGYAYRLLDIPADKLLLFVHRQEGQNFEGVSLYRSAYQHWWYKQQFYKIQAIDIERNSVPVPVITLPEGFSESDFLAAQSILGNLRVNESMGVTLPPGWTLDYANSHGKQATQIQPAIDHHDVMMARAVLAQFINLGSTETGAFALDASQKATLLAALQAECEYIEDVFNNDAIPRLVDYNYAGVEGYPKLKCAKVLAQDFDAIANALNKLVNIPTGGLIHPDLELEDFLRNELGLPKAPKSVIEGYNPTSPNTPSQPTMGGSSGSDNAGGAGSSQDESGTAENTGEGKGGEGQTADGGSSDLPDQGGPDGGGGADGGGGGGGSLSELRSEAQLLREALAAARQWDAVDRGMRFFDPVHDAKGRFGTTGGGGEHESEGGSKGVGGAKARGGAGKSAKATGVAKGGGGRKTGGAKAKTEEDAPKGGAKVAKPTAEERAAGRAQAKAEREAKTTAYHARQDEMMNLQPGTGAMLAKHGFHIDPPVSEAESGQGRSPYLIGREDGRAFLGQNVRAGEGGQMRAVWTAGEVSHFAALVAAHPNTITPPGAKNDTLIHARIARGNDHLSSTLEGLGQARNELAGMTTAKPGGARSGAAKAPAAKAPAEFTRGTIQHPTLAQFSRNFQGEELHGALSKLSMSNLRGLAKSEGTPGGRTREEIVKGLVAKAHGEPAAATATPTAAKAEQAAKIAAYHTRQDAQHGYKPGTSATLEKHGFYVFNAPAHEGGGRIYTISREDGKAFLGQNMREGEDGHGQRAVFSAHEVSHFAALVAAHPGTIVPRTDKAQEALIRARSARGNDHEIKAPTLAAIRAAHDELAGMTTARTTTAKASGTGTRAKSGGSGAKSGGTRMISEAVRAAYAAGHSGVGIPPNVHAMSRLFSRAELPGALSKYMMPMLRDAATLEGVRGRTRQEIVNALLNKVYPS